jgi:hypothetical protein
MKIVRPSGVTVRLEDWEAERLVREITEVVENYHPRSGTFPVALADFAKALKEPKK